MTLTYNVQELNKPSPHVVFDSTLGNHASISSRTEKRYTLSSSQEKKSRRFMLLDNARRILRNHNVTNRTGTEKHRTRTCLSVRYDKTEPIGITLNDNPERSAAGVTNLVTCGSICSCPVCAHKLMLEKAEMVQRALVWAENNGFVPIMLTLTASHHKGTDLAEFKDQFKSAWRLFSSGRQWKEFKSDWNIEHWISAREATREAIKDNGWHYHMHVLLFISKSQIRVNDAIESLSSLFTERWLHCLNSRNLVGDENIACKLTSGANVGKQYLTKLGISHTASGKLEYEMTGNANKGRTIWDVLYDASFGDIRAEYLYVEYVEVMTGENWITTSHGLQDLIADIELPVSESDEDEKLVLWYWISQENWSVVVRKHQVSHLLHLAARYRSRTKIDEFIKRLKCDD